MANKKRILAQNVAGSIKGNYYDAPPTAQDEIVGKTSTQTVTNKTLSAPVLSGTVTGTYTLGGTPTLTSPTINSPTLTTPNVAVIRDTASTNRIVLNSAAKTIVDGSATSLFEVACAAAEMVGGIVHFLVRASDGTDHQAIAGIMSYSAVNKAGTITADETYATANEAKAVSAGTLTLAFTVVDSTNKITVKLQPTGSLTETTPYTIEYTVFPIRGAVTIL